MIQKALQAGSHSGGKVECRRGDPPQAENPAKQDSNSYHRKVLGLKVARKNNPPKGGHGKADDG